ncbi:hypothetical protein [Actinoplanes sp. HUAS TT8]|uniref:hypothetical protein n=1 Tax=Actinoplanes sp. HUAS TT8 TaxID=3447453 RepID=UPI003F51CC51
MRFTITSDVAITVAFEPTAAIYPLRAGEEIIVEWTDGADDGAVTLEAGDMVVHTPSGGSRMRAWRSDGSEIHIGPDSGPEAM